MSPEQINAPREVDARSDVWALGVTLYELIAGKRPFDADTIPNLFACILRDDPQPLSELVPDLPAGLDGVIECCLAKNPVHRYQDASQLAGALGAFASAALPVAKDAPPRNAGYTRFRPFAAIATAAAACAALVFALQIGKGGSSHPSLPPVATAPAAIPEQQSAVTPVPAPLPPDLPSPSTRAAAPPSAPSTTRLLSPKPPIAPKAQPPNREPDAGAVSLPRAEPAESLPFDLRK
jgi:serine/threonine-protein kinase